MTTTTTRTTATAIVVVWIIMLLSTTTTTTCTNAFVLTTTSNRCRRCNFSSHPYRSSSSSLSSLSSLPAVVVPNNSNNIEPFTSAVTYRYDNTSEEGYIAHVKYFIQQTDCGLLDPTILADENQNNQNHQKQNNRFRYISSTIPIPLSKTDYIVAGRYFNLRNAFPDYDDRPYDFRIIIPDNDEKDDIISIRCTCRRTGTMRGELRLRNHRIYAPTGLTMNCPPECITISFHRTTGKIIKYCTGFVLDRSIGNTQGTTGIVAASIIAGALNDNTDNNNNNNKKGDNTISPWELYPPISIIRHVFARPIINLPRRNNKNNNKSTSTTNPIMAPFPESVMIQLAKGILSSQMAYTDPTLLNDITFTYQTPLMVGPIQKQDYLQYYATQQELQEQEFLEPQYTNFRVDPYDPVRVWVDVVPITKTTTTTTTTKRFIGPPYGMSFTFDENGYCTGITSQAILDPTVSTMAGGLCGYDGYLYSIGQGRPGIFTRPISQSIERLQLRLLSPFSGRNVDDYQFPRQGNNNNNLWQWLLSTITQTSEPQKTVQLQPKPPKTIPVVENNEVVKRLEQLKEFTSSIRIVPPSLSNINNANVRSSSSSTVQERLAKAAKATEQSKLLIDQAKRDAVILQQKIARAEANALKQQQQQMELLARQQQQQQQQSAAAAKAAAAEQQKKKKMAAESAAAARQKQQQQQQRSTVAAIQQQKKAAAAETAARQKQQQQTAAAAVAQQKAAQVARQKQEQERVEKTRQLALEEKQRKEQDIERQQRAAAEVVIRQRELEAQQIVDVAAREAKKVQLMKERLAATEATTRRRNQEQISNTAMKAKAAAERLTTTTKRAMNSDNGTPILPALARATISLFGLGKSELDELPASKVNTSPSKSKSVQQQTSAPGRRRTAPMGVPTVTRWRQNSDATITGLVKGSRNFDDGSRITTSPITNGSVISGEVVRTGSGSRYFLE